MHITRLHSVLLKGGKCVRNSLRYGVSELTVAQGGAAHTRSEPLRTYSMEVGMRVRSRLQFPRLILASMAIFLSESSDPLLAQPANVPLFSPMSVTTHSMVLTWTTFSDSVTFKEYRLYKSSTPSVTTSSTLLATITDRTVASVTDSLLRASSLHYYKVFVVDTLNVLSSGSNEVFATTKANLYPFFDNAEADASLRFDIAAPWARDTAFPYAGVYAWSESPSGNYATTVDASLLLHVDLSTATMPVLTFQTRYGLEANGDYGRVEVSIGGDWTIVAYVTGSQSAWKRISADLTQWAGNADVRVRFRLLTNGNATVSNGWHIDDISVAETPSPALGYPLIDLFEDTTSRAKWHWGQWDIQSGGHNSNGQIHDSPVGPYLQSGVINTYVDNPNSFTGMVTSGVIDLSGAVDPILTFWQRYDFFNWEDGCWYQYDYGRIYISPNYGLPGSWTQIYAVGDNQNTTALATWQYVEIDLSSYVGSSTVRIMFVVDDMPDTRSGCGDQSGAGDGWYLDDIRIDNRPTSVTLQPPTNVSMHGADLSWSMNADADFLQFELYRSTSSGVSRTDTRVATFVNQATTSYRDDYQILQPNIYYYRMYVVDSLDRVSYGSNVVSAPYTVPTVSFPFSDNVDSASSATKWAWGVPWARSTDQSHSGSYSWTDSPGSSYGPNTNSSLSTFINLSLSSAPVLSFWHRYVFETNADYGYVEVSTDGGTTWSRALTVTGVDTNWTEQRIDLSAHVGGTIGLRFRVQTNATSHLDGWFVDDIVIDDGSRVVGYPFTENFESGFGKWFLDSPWGLTSVNPHGGSVSMAESPSGIYAPTVDAGLHLHINLSTSVMPLLKFWTRYATEINGDYGRVEVRASGAWTVAAYVSGSNTAWQEVKVDLTQWAGNSDVHVRFRFLTNGNETIGDGWYIDDVSIAETPTPSLAYPLIETFDDETSASRWHGGQWSVLTNGRSSPGLIHDSPTGPYLQSGAINTYVDDPNSFSALVSAGTFDLTNARNPVLTFYQKLDFFNWEDGCWYQYDMGRVYVSSNYGQPGSWNQVYSVGDNQNTNALSAWQRVEVNLSSYAGLSNVRVMFVVDDMPDTRSGCGDQSGAGDGWYLDDIRLEDRVADVALAGPTNVTLHGASLAWTRNQDINFQHYKVYRHTSAAVDTNSILVAVITNRADTSLHDVYQILQPGTYYYRVYTVDTLGTYSFGSNVVNAVYQVPTIVFPFTENVDSAAAEIRWAWSAPWARTTARAHSGLYSWTDSPGASSPPNANTSLTTFVNLTLSGTPVLTFWHAYSMEAGADFGYVEVSDNDGATWTRIHSVSGVDTSWNVERIDLTPWTGRTIGLRFRLTTNGSIESDGWYIDDIAILNGDRIVAYPYVDDIESGPRSMFTDSPWGIASVNAHSGSNYWSNSPAGNYNPSADNSLSFHVDLSQAQMPLMTFWTRYGTQVNTDYCRVEVRVASNWIVAAYFSGSQSDWKQIRVDLTQWAKNSNVEIRFRFTSNSDATVSDGWDIDDIHIAETPTPVLAYPFTESFDDSSMIDRFHMGSWGRQTGGRSSPFSIHDSPTGPYLQSGSQDSYGDDPNSFTFIITSGVIDLTDAVNPALTFYHKYDFYNWEDGCWYQYDYGRVYISTNYGLPGTWTEIYTIGDNQNTNALGSWQKVELNLASYIGHATVRLMFVMDDMRDTRTGCGDQSGAGDGWYLDDIRLGENLVAASVVDSAYIVGPATTSTTPGTPTVRLFGKVYEGGVTNAAGQGAGIMAELGYGPPGSDPADSTWVWVSATYGSDDGLFDRYYGTLSVPEIGSYDYAFRFTLNGGARWVYADLNGNAEGTNSANGYDPGMAGNLVVSRRPQALIGVDSLHQTMPVEMRQNWSFVLANAGVNAEGPLSFSFIETLDTMTTVDVGWFSVNPARGTLQPGERVVVTATFDATGLVPDTSYNALLLVRTNDPDRMETILDVRLQTLQVGVTVLAGAVVDLSGGPLGSLARVEVIEGGSITAAAISDEGGNFAFFGLSAGAYRLRVHAPGFYPYTLRSVEVPGDRIILRLSRTPVIALTDQSANFWGSLSMFDGAPLRPGDVVTVADPDNVVCGVFTVDSSGAYGFMHVYGDDGSTSEIDEGASPGDTLRFFVNESPAPSSGPDAPVWMGNLTTSHVELNASKLDILPLNVNWNLSSFTAIPPNDSIHVVLQSIGGTFTLVSSFDQSLGGARTYDPALLPFSDLWHVDPMHGYWIRMSSADTLQVDGERLYTDALLPLEQGWNLTGYLPEHSLEVAKALGSIAGKYSVVSGFDDGAQTFVPGSPLSDLTNMKNGFGYWVKTTEPALLQYSRSTPLGVPSRVSDQSSQKSVVASVLMSPWWTDYYGTINEGGVPLPVGAVMQAFDPDGVKCGEVVIRQTGLYGFLHVYGDDPATSGLDEGAEAGDDVSFVVNGKIVARTTLPDHRWKGDRSSISLSIDVSAGNGTTAALPTVFELSQNYPNPFNPSTLIRYQVPEEERVHITIHDLLGREIVTLVNDMTKPGEYVARWNAQDATGDIVPGGTYFCRMKAGTFTRTMKLLLLK